MLKLVVAMGFHTTVPSDVVVDVFHSTRSENSVAQSTVANRSKFSTDQTNNITKTVFLYLVWSFKNMVIGDKQVNQQCKEKLFEEDLLIKDTLLLGLDES